jgi:hypothetical protein
MIHDLTMSDTDTERVTLRNSFVPLPPTFWMTFCSKAIPDYPLDTQSSPLSFPKNESQMILSTELHAAWALLQH